MPDLFGLFELYLYELVIIALAARHLTYLIKDSEIAEPLRERLMKISFFNRMLSCDICTGTNATLIMAFMYLEARAELNLVEHASGPYQITFLVGSAFVALGLINALAASTILTALLYVGDVAEYWREYMVAKQSENQDDDPGATS